MKNVDHAAANVGLKRAWGETDDSLARRIALHFCRCGRVRCLFATPKLHWWARVITWVWLA